MDFHSFCNFRSTSGVKRQRILDLKRANETVVHSSRNVEKHAGLLNTKINRDDVYAIIGNWKIKLFKTPFNRRRQRRRTHNGSRHTKRDGGVYVTIQNFKNTLWRNGRGNSVGVTYYHGKIIIVTITEHIIICALIGRPPSSFGLHFELCRCRAVIFPCPSSLLPRFSVISKRRFESFIVLYLLSEYLGWTFRTRCRDRRTRWIYTNVWNWSPDSHIKPER